MAGWITMNDTWFSYNEKWFMAMNTGRKEVDWIYENYFKNAVRATGFDLYCLDEAPKAGLIDDKLRVEITTSRFLIYN